MSSTILGSGEYRYRIAEGWQKLPEGWELGDVAAVGVDRHDNVYAFHRGKHPMIVFDREGNFLRSWGDDIFKRAHGISMAPDDTIFCTDDGDHTVRRCTLDGRVLKQGDPLSLSLWVWDPEFLRGELRQAGGPHVLRRVRDRPSSPTLHIAAGSPGKLCPFLRIVGSPANNPFLEHLLGSALRDPLGERLVLLGHRMLAV